MVAEDMQPNKELCPTGASVWLACTLGVQRVVGHIREGMGFYGHLPAEHLHEGKMFHSQANASSNNLKPCVLYMQMFVGAHDSG